MICSRVSLKLGKAGNFFFRSSSSEVSSSPLTHLQRRFARWWWYRSQSPSDKDLLAAKHFCQLSNHTHTHIYIYTFALKEYHFLNRRRVFHRSFYKYPCYVIRERKKNFTQRHPAYVLFRIFPELCYTHVHTHTRARTPDAFCFQRKYYFSYRNGIDLTRCNRDHVVQFRFKVRACIIFRMSKVSVAKFINVSSFLSFAD